jgi:DnaJ-class molecular chaperone
MGKEWNLFTVSGDGADSLPEVTDATDADCCPTCDGYGSAHGGMGPLCEDCIGSGVREREED